MDMKHISRVETGKTNGYQVRMRRDGINHSKFFSLQRFGDLEKALSAAQQYRDTLVKIAPPSKTNAVRTHRDSGIHLESSGGYKAWVAQWTDENGDKRTKKFNIKKYGNLRAQQMARKERLLGVARLNKAEPKRVPTLDELVC